MVIPDEVCPVHGGIAMEPSSKPLLKGRADAKTAFNEPAPVTVAVEPETETPAVATQLLNV
jgi:hypothetical protein